MLVAWMIYYFENFAIVPISPLIGILAPIAKSSKFRIFYFIPLFTKSEYSHSSPLVCTLLQSSFWFFYSKSSEPIDGVSQLLFYSILRKSLCQLLFYLSSLLPLV